MAEAMEDEYERYVRRSIHPTAGSQFTYVLGPPVEPPIWVKKREHNDRPRRESDPRVAAQLRNKP